MTPTEKGLRALLECVPDAMVIVNKDGDIVDVNSQAERLFGYREAELLEQSVESLTPERFRARHREHRKDYFKDPRLRPMGAGFELYGLRKDGSEFPVEISLSPIESEDGLLAAAAIRDITEHKRSEEQLKQTLEELERSNENLEELAYVASHDLQSPLYAVKGYVELLAKRYRSRLDSEADEFLQGALAGITRMQALINSLLEYARLGAQPQSLKRTNFEFVLGQALADLRAVLEETGARVTHDPLPTLLCDESQMVQLLQNLVGNGIKFHREESPLVHVSARLCGDEWLFSVQDNGVGIDPKHQGRIFGLFQRLHGNELYKGSGVGLAICKKIVERHAGRIWVESELGRGSTFYFTFPERRE